MASSEYSLKDFCVHFSQNAPQIMWFLGAGASRSALIPTAWDLIWELKCKLYCLAEGNDISKYKNYTTPAIRAEVQNYFSGKAGFPAEDSLEEYSFYFEQMFEGDKGAQRKFIDETIRNTRVTPSYGHKYLGLLLKEGHSRIVWTTNFDSVVEDGYAKVEGIPSNLNVAHLEAPSLALSALNDKKFPLYVKLHGDFRYDELKNTTKELKTQNAEFSKTLEIACNQFGMAIVGYSGRDKSVMDVLHAALEQNNPFPLGLFWFVRTGTKPLPAVEELIAKAQKKKVTAHIVEVGTFDELMMKLKKSFSKIASETAVKYLDKRIGLPSIAMPALGTGYPIIKTNAVLVTEIPDACYRTTGKNIEHKELNKICKDSGGELTAVLRNGEILSIAKKEIITKFLGGNPDVFPITLALATEPLEYPVRSLLRNAIGGGLIKDRPLRAIYRKQELFIRPDTAQVEHESLATLKSSFGPSLHGTVPGTTITWNEAIRIRLDAKYDRLWLVITPDIFLGTGDYTRATFDKEIEASREFVRNRTKMRRNYETAKLLGIWNKILGLGEANIFSPTDESITRQFKTENDFDSSGRA